MSRTPLHNRALTDSKDRTPPGARVVKDKVPHAHRTKDASIDQCLLDVLRSLNLAVAAVAQARDRRFTDPNAKLSPDTPVQALLHLKDAAQQLDALRRDLAEG
jgi:hypothetical protein